MNDKLDTLPAKYPHLFPKHRETGEPTFYFECGDGWFDLIDCLLAEIDHYYQQWEHYAQARDKALAEGKEIPEYAQRYLKEKPENPLANFQVEQVKEKFGGLRFYTTYANDEIHGAISFAETLSFRICETCGNPGKVFRKSWIVTRCEKHMPDDPLTKPEPQLSPK